MKLDKTTSVEVRPNSKAGISSVPKSVATRLGNVENLTQAVIWVGLIALVAIVVSVTTMVIDQEHFNNETYKEQTTNLQTQVQALQDEVSSLKATK